MYSTTLGGNRCAIHAKRRVCTGPQIVHVRHSAVPNAKAKDELRPTAQIAKERRKTAGIRARLKSKKGKKGSNR